MNGRHLHIGLLQNKITFAFAYYLGLEYHSLANHGPLHLGAHLGFTGDFLTQIVESFEMNGLPIKQDDMGKGLFFSPPFTELTL